MHRRGLQGVSIIVYSTPKINQFVTNPRHKGGRPLTHKNTRHKHTREDTTQLNIRLQVFIKTTTVTNNNDYTIG